MSSLTGRTPRDANRVPATFGVSSADGIAALPIEIDPITGRLLVDSVSGGGGSAVTIADGADVAEGATTDAVVAAGAAGTISAKLRRVTTDLDAVKTNTTGLATSANQTNGNQQTKITDGTNIANVAAGDTGFNSVVTSGGVKTITFTTSIAGAQTLLANTDFRGYNWLEVVLTANGSGLAWAGQWSTVSGGTYVSLSTFGTNGGAQSAALGTSTGTIYTSSAHGNFFQIAVSALASGTVTGTLTLHSSAVPQATTNAAQSGTWTVQPGNTANTTPWLVNALLNPSGTVLNTFSTRLTSNTTTTPTSSTAYISSIILSSEVAGTTSTLTIQDKQGTPLKLVNGFTTVAVTTTPTVINFQTPIKMTSGIDIITAGAVAATVDVWVNYYQ